MDDRRVAEYFMVAGLPLDPKPLAEFSCDGAPLKPTHSLPPVTDIGIVNRSLGEVVPDGYTCIEHTVGGVVANLNHGVLRSQEIFIYYKRGRDKPPLVDIGVLLEGRERLLPDSQVVEFTAGNHNANINPNGVASYITYRRATEESTCNELVVSDICVFMTNKGETAPHSYCTIERNLNKGTVVGADIFLGYKKSVNRTNYLAYNAAILDCYPFSARPNFPLPDNLALFCLPMGATLEAWPRQAKAPEEVFSTFVLTILPSSSNVEDGQEPGIENIEKVYGAAITFYERYPHDKLIPEQKQDLQLNDHFGRRNLIHTNKCICILSLWPFFDTFEKFLKYLHKMALTGNHKVPIERYIWHMLECVPFPSAERPRILIQLDFKEGITLAQPEDSPISLSGASFRKLVMCLRPEGCLLVMLYALTEQKILLHSLRPDVLTAVAEALTMIIFPFHWQCPYIPLCPLGLSDFLDAPTPFLLGLDSRFFDLYDPPPDVICIDLDTAALSIPEDKKHLTTKLLPKKASRILKSSLESLCSRIKHIDEQIQRHNLKKNIILDQNIDFDFKMKKKEQELEVEIQETFLRFTATILRGYSQYLLPIITVKLPEDSGTPVLFDVEGFVRSREKAYQKFFEMMVSTQMFSRFIEERSFVSDKDASLVFFDDCIEKVRDEEPGVRLLEVEPTSSEHTFFLLPPEPPIHAPIDGYAYDGFPKLRKELFPVKEVLKALPPEFTNQQKQKGLGVGSPGSPLARRSKHEIKSAQRMTYRYYQTPILWAKCLLSTCFSLWFAHLPSFITVHAQKGRVLDLAFHILQRIQNQSLTHQDEVCYRVMMQLCGVYSKPVLAVKTLCEMRNAGIVPNAITYGYYNRALLESKWNPSNLLWNKLRNVMLGVSAFRQCGVERANRRKSLEEDIISNDADSASRVSIESVASCESNKVSQFKTDTLSSDPGYCSISENCEAVNISPSSTTTTSACNEGDLLSRSESNLSLSPVQENILSSGDTSYSSATATVTYDTAPSSPIIAPQSTHIPSSVVTSSTNLTPQSGPHSPCVVTSTPVSTPDTPLSPVVTSITSLLSPTSTTDTKSPIKNIDESVSSSSRNISSLYSPSGNKSSFYSGLFFNNFIPSNFKTNTTTPSSTATVTPNENKVILQSLSSNTSSHFNNLDFTHSDELRKKLGSIVRSSTAGLASGVQLSLIETHPLLVNSAGLLMTSPLDASYLSPERKPKPKPTDLAEALSSTLEKYDQIKEPSLILPNSFDSHSAEKGTVDYLRSYNYGKDEKIVKKLLNLVYPLDDPEVTVDKAKVTSDIIKKSESEKKRLDRNNKRQVSKTSKRQVDCVPPSGQSAQSSLYGVEKVLLEKKKVVHEFIDAEDDSDYGLETANSGVKQFFGRNTPERISSLWRRGVLGADVNLRGIWKKNPSRDNSKDEHQSSLGAGGAKNTKERRTSKKNLIKQLDKTSQEIKQSDTMSSEELKVECFISLDESTGVNPSVAPVLEKTVVEGRQVVLAGDPLGALNKQLFESPGGLPRDLKETSHGNFLDVNKSLPELRGPLLQINKSTQKSRTLDDSSRILNKPPKHPNKLVSTSLTKNIMYDPLGVFDDPNDDPFIPETQTPTHYSSMSKLNRNDPINSPENDFKSRSSTNLFSTPFSGEEFAPSANRVPGIVSNQQPDTLLPVTPFKLSGTSTLGLASSVATHGLRQATKHIETLRTQYFDPAMTELVSQSNFSSRRNDLISGSLSSMRSAVSSLSKKYNSIREAISHTPVKNSWRNDEGYIDSPDGFWMRRESCESALSSSEDTFNNFPLSKDDDQNTEVDRSLPNSWLQTGPFCLGIWITSCSKCHNCEAILYDEEIMSGWRPDDSNLNTRCWHCSKVTVPILTVSIYYLRHLPKPTNEKITTNKESSNVDSSNAERRKTAKQNKRSFNDETIAHIQDKGIPLEPLTVPYLSPLVLRKELETMLGHDGDSSLSLPSFPEQHPILYWNLLWYFSRLRLPSHLSSLCLSSLSSLKDRPVHDHWKEADWRHVYVRCLWDNIHYHQELGSPLYMQWKENYSPSTLLQALTPLRAKVPKSVLESYLTLLHFNQVDRCLELMLQTLRKRPAELRYKHYPIYRDLFFFTLTALPRQELNIMRFEQEFRKEFDKVQPPNAKIINESDGPPPIPAVFCRKYFWDLSL